MSSISHSGFCVLIGIMFVTMILSFAGGFILKDYLKKDTCYNKTLFILKDKQKYICNSICSSFDNPNFTANQIDKLGQVLYDGNK